MISIIWEAAKFPTSLHAGFNSTLIWYVGWAANLALVTSGKNLESVNVLYKLLDGKRDATDCVASKENNQQEPIEQDHGCPIPEPEWPVKEASFSVSV